jgi:hypothetical protein
MAQVLLFKDYVVIEFLIILCLWNCTWPATVETNIKEHEQEENSLSWLRLIFFLV